MYITFLGTPTTGYVQGMIPDITCDVIGFWLAHSGPDPFICSN